LRDFLRQAPAGRLAEREPPIETAKGMQMAGASESGDGASLLPLLLDHTLPSSRLAARLLQADAEQTQTPLQMEPARQAGEASAQVRIIVGLN